MRPANPTSADVMHAWFRNYFQDLHTAFPARVQSYDPASQTADLQPLIQHAVEQSDGSTEYEELPILPSVPIMFPRTAGWFIALPIDVGDTVLVICCESAIGNWRAGDGSLEYPGDVRRHHVAHAVALPGLFVHSAALANAPPRPTGSGVSATQPALVLGKDASDGTRITIKLNGEIAITQGSNVRLQITSDGIVSLGGAIADTGFIMPGPAIKGYVNDHVKAQFNQLLQDYGIHGHTGTAGPYSVVIVPGPQVATEAQSLPDAPDLSGVVKAKP